jgi:hypothetical protein
LSRPTIALYTQQQICIYFLTFKNDSGMNEKMKKQPNFSLGKEIAKKEQKKVLGGALAYGCGQRCKNSFMNCTTSPISYGYCLYVWPASGGSIETCSCS